MDPERLADWIDAQLAALTADRRRPASRASAPLRHAPCPCPPAWWLRQHRLTVAARAGAARRGLPAPWRAV